MPSASEITEREGSIGFREEGDCFQSAFVKRKIAQYLQSDNMLHLKGKP